MLFSSQDCLPIVLEVLATAAGDKVPKGSPQRSVAADAMRLLHSLQKQEALRTKVTSVLESGGNSQPGTGTYFKLVATRKMPLENFENESKCASVGHLQSS